MKFKVGDVVSVIDAEYSYSTNYNFFEREKDNLEWDWILRYAYGINAHNIDTNVYYKILYISDYADQALITYANGDGTANSRSKIYLIDLLGLVEKGTKVMTHKQIKELLGYDIIIKEDED